MAVYVEMHFTRLCIHVYVTTFNLYYFTWFHREFESTISLICYKLFCTFFLMLTIGGIVFTLSFIQYVTEKSLFTCIWWIYNKFIRSMNSWIQWSVQHIEKFQWFQNNSSGLEINMLQLLGGQSSITIMAMGYSFISILC